MSLDKYPVGTFTTTLFIENSVTPGVTTANPWICVLHWDERTPVGWVAPAVWGAAERLNYFVNLVWGSSDPAKNRGGLGKLIPAGTRLKQINVKGKAAVGVPYPGQVAGQPYEYEVAGLNASGDGGGGGVSQPLAAIVKKNAGPGRHGKGRIYVPNASGGVTVAGVFNPEAAGITAVGNWLADANTESRQFSGGKPAKMQLLQTHTGTPPVELGAYVIREVGSLAFSSTVGVQRRRLR